MAAKNCWCHEIPEEERPCVPCDYEAERKTLKYKLEQVKRFVISIGFNKIFRFGRFTLHAYWQELSFARRIDFATSIGLSPSNRMFTITLDILLGGIALDFDLHPEWDDIQEQGFQ